MTSFKELNLSPAMARAIDELGFATPSSIQAQTLPILLGEPTDFIGQAATGTGKTAAFGIPLLEQITLNQKTVQALILCPTRELALQVCGQINLLGKFNRIKALPIYGGSNYSDQITGLKHGDQVVVATPGRVVDHLNRGTLKLDHLKTLVLDEADEMISMGFKDELELILKSVPREKCHIWLFSATLSKEVRRVADSYLHSPKQVQMNGKEVLSNNVEQVFYPSRESDKPEILCKLIDATDDFYGVIFCQTKSMVNDVHQHLSGRGFKVDCLHGDKNQGDRERTMQAFRDRKVSILVCTDVASRGLDVKDLTHVVNYSIPRELDVYVHRIGRTARGGKSGIAISLVTPSHRGLIARIEQKTKSRIKEGRIPTRKEIGAKKIAQLLDKFQEQEQFSRASELLSSAWKTAVADMPREEIVGRFMTLHWPEIFSSRTLTQKKPTNLNSEHRPDSDSEFRRDQRQTSRQSRDYQDDRSSGRRPPWRQKLGGSQVENHTEPQFAKERRAAKPTKNESSSPFRPSRPSKSPRFKSNSKSNRQLKDDRGRRGGW